MVCVTVVKFITKIILFLINLVFTIFGFALAIPAIVFYVKLKDLVASTVDKEGLMESTLQWMAIGVISLGFVIFIIAFCGCVGSITENKCLLITYAVFLLAIIGGKSYIAIKYRDINEIQRPVEKYLKNAFESKTDKLTFRLFEVSLHCCGTKGPDSYDALYKRLVLPSIGTMPLEKLRTVPVTCCAEKITSFEALIELCHKFIEMFKSPTYAGGVCLIEDASQYGCLNVANDIIEKYVKIIQNSMIAMIVIEILEFLASIFLCVVKSQRNKNQKYYY